MPRSSIKSYRAGQSQLRGRQALGARYMATRKAVARSGYATVPRARGWASSGEMKYFDCERQTAAIAAVTTSWGTGTRLDPSSTIDIGAAAVATPLNLCSPTVGSGLNQRIGRKIHVRKIKIRGQIQVPSQTTQSTADNACKVRMLLLMDKQTNAAQYSAGDVLNPAGTAPTTINAFQNPNGFGRFNVLKDKLITVGNVNMAGSPSGADVIQSGMIRDFKITYNFKKPVEVNFNATNGGTVADIVDNSFHIMIGTQDAAYAPTITYYSRCAYTE